jgi:hypothetical protein
VNLAIRPANRKPANATGRSKCVKLKSNDIDGTGGNPHSRPSTGSEGFRRAIRFSGLGRQDDRFADGRKIERAPQRADDLGGALLLEIEADAVGRLADRCHRAEPQRFDPLGGIHMTNKALIALQKIRAAGADQQIDQQSAARRASAARLCGYPGRPRCEEGSGRTPLSGPRSVTPGTAQPKSKPVPGRIRFSVSSPPRQMRWSSRSIRRTCR